eukprot:Rmarinus@m.27010
MEGAGGDPPFSANFEAAFESQAGDGDNWAAFDDAFVAGGVPPKSISTNASSVPPVGNGFHAAAADEPDDFGAFAAGETAGNDDWANFDDGNGFVGTGSTDQPGTVPEDNDDWAAFESGHNEKDCLSTDPAHAQPAQDDSAGAASPQVASAEASMDVSGSGEGAGIEKNANAAPLSSDECRQGGDETAKTDALPEGTARDSPGEVSGREAQTSFEINSVSESSVDLADGGDTRVDVAASLTASASESIDQRSDGVDPSANVKVEVAVTQGSFEPPESSESVASTAGVADAADSAPGSSTDERCDEDTAPADGIGQNNVAPAACKDSLSPEVAVRSDSDVLGPASFVEMSESVPVPLVSGETGSVEVDSGESTTTADMMHGPPSDCSPAEAVADAGEEHKVGDPAAPMSNDCDVSAAVTDANSSPEVTPDMMGGKCDDLVREEAPTVHAVEAADVTASADASVTESAEVDLTTLSATATCLDDFPPSTPANNAGDQEVGDFVVSGSVPESGQVSSTDSTVREPAVGELEVEGDPPCSAAPDKMKDENGTDKASDPDLCEKDNSAGSGVMTADTTGGSLPAVPCDGDLDKDGFSGFVDEENGALGADVNVGKNDADADDDDWAAFDDGRGFVEATATGTAVTSDQISTAIGNDGVDHGGDDDDWAAFEGAATTGADHQVGRDLGGESCGGDTGGNDGDGDGGDDDDDWAAFAGGDAADAAPNPTAEDEAWEFQHTSGSSQDVEVDGASSQPTASHSSADVFRATVLRSGAETSISAVLSLLGEPAMCPLQPSTVCPKDTSLSSRPPSANGPSSSIRRAPQARWKWSGSSLATSYSRTVLPSSTLASRVRRVPRQFEFTPTSAAFTTQCRPSTGTLPQSSHPSSQSSPASVGGATSMVGALSHPDMSPAELSAISSGQTSPKELASGASSPKGASPSLGRVFGFDLMRRGSRAKAKSVSRAVPPNLPQPHQQSASSTNTAPSAPRGSTEQKPLPAFLDTTALPVVDLLSGGEPQASLSPSMPVSGSGFSENDLDLIFGAPPPLNAPMSMGCDLDLLGPADDDDDGFANWSAGGTSSAACGSGHDGGGQPSESTSAPAASAVDRLEKLLGERLLTEAELSDTARALVSDLPDLSFMLSPCLVRPIA